MIHPTSKSKTESHCHPHGNARNVPGRPPSVVHECRGQLSGHLSCGHFPAFKNVIDDLLRKVDGMIKANRCILINGVAYSILFVCETKVRLSKQHDEDHERDAAQRYPTHVQSVTYPANTQAKEEDVPAANQDMIRQSWRHVNGHYPAGIQPLAILAGNE
ncbi:hypothetical protein TNCV_732571 [Trichonephila clavipes]|nr:hypothetical protein TNCV_732571 [Trichonephila clavipes]